mgnify:CR=1 FL=1
MLDVLILGSGPAGLTAAIYSCRAGYRVLVIGGFQIGGQLVLTTEVENYPGFYEGVQGPVLMERMRMQAERFGAVFIDEDATAVDFAVRPFKVYVRDHVFEARAVIIATGSSPLWLGLASEAMLRGRGVSSCATCDGPFFQSKQVCVVGGGDTAVEEALFLSKYAERVHVIHRRDRLRAVKFLQDKVLKNDKVEFIWDSVVEDILGEEKVKGVRLRNVKTGKLTEVPCEGVFVAIGHKPNTEIFRGQVELDAWGYIVRHDETKTNVEGVFCAGDVCDYSYRQAITAAAAGCKAAIDAGHFL